VPNLILAADPFGILMTALGLGALIFIHELGHFLACRVTGTRVEAFAIGFGPQIFGWRRGGTVYKLCAIPLGGYVKMAAENPGEENTGAPDEFPNKSYSQRLLIMSAGVIFNAILAMFLFAWAFGIGVPYPKPMAGTVSPGGAAWVAGVQRGDIVRAVNGDQILSFEDLSMEVLLSAKDEALTLTIDRDGTEIEIEVTPEYSERSGMPSMGVRAPNGATAVDIVADSPVAKAGGRAGDEIVNIGNTPISDPEDAQMLISRMAGRAPKDAKTFDALVTVKRADGTEATLTIQVPIERSAPQIGATPYYGNTITSLRSGTPTYDVLRKDDRVESIDGWAFTDIGIYRQMVAPNRDAAPTRSVEIERDGKKQTVSIAMSERDFAQSLHLGTTEFTAAQIAPTIGMPAEKAGLLAGDTVVAVGETKISTWEEMNKAILANGANTLTLEVKRSDGTSHTFSVEPAGRAYLFGAGYKFTLAMSLAQESNFFSALGIGLDRTVRSLQQVVLTLKNLVTQRVSARHIGGPIKIAQVTYTVLEDGWARYLYILALISMNLAVLNLLPIPVLDGGQIVLLTAEKIRGAPLPDKVVGYFQIVGLVLLLALIALALTNDITSLLS
jgi:regulator of sigma E protease